MENLSRKRLPHSIPHWVEEESFFFITINCAHPGQNELTRAGIGEAVLTAAAHHHERLRWYCRLMLLMPDHLHTIIAFPRDLGMKTTIAHWKRYLARNHAIEWQRDFFDHRLRDHWAVIEKTDYILQNPIRRNLCERLEEWPWIYRPQDRPPPSVAR